MPGTTYPAWPTPTDNVKTVTSDDQLETEKAIYNLFAPHRHPKLNHVQPTEPTSLVNPWLSDAEQRPSSVKLPTLQQSAHLSFLAKMLEPLPGSYVSFESNRSWLLYWVLHSYDLLSATLDAKGRARAIATLLSFQNKETGGFGGGPNQIAHLMSTYAAVCALAIVGGPGPSPTAEEVAEGKSNEIGKGGWDEIDRLAMYDWIMSLKQPDGSFLVHSEGEIDVRASYCVICISSLLGICTKEMVRGMGDFISSCQTYEGGLSASSQPSYSNAMLLDQAAPRPALGEAHGGYTYCALATHLALSCLPDCGEGGILPSLPASKYGGGSRSSSAGTLNIPLLVRWATSQQGTPIEGGAFRGRTNKLVDGCYSWFNGGGLFSVLGPLVKGADVNGLSSLPKPAASAATGAQSDYSSAEWTTDSESSDIEQDTSPTALYDRLALQEYILIAAQPASGGGLRDKPGKQPDAYHTCYNLCGLSLSQHSLHRSKETRAALESAYKGTDDSWKKACYIQSLSWTIKQSEMLIVGNDSTNLVNPTHPVFGITFPKAKAMMDWSYTI